MTYCEAMTSPTLSFEWTGQEMFSDFVTTPYFLSDFHFLNQSVGEHFYILDWNSPWKITQKECNDLIFAVLDRIFFSK